MNDKAEAEKVIEHIKTYGYHTVDELHFVCLSPEACDYVAEKTGIKRTLILGAFYGNE